jgi:hypothetical protein
VGSPGRQTPGYRGTLNRRPRHSNVQHANFLARGLSPSISEGIEEARDHFSSLRRAARAAVKDEHELDDWEKSQVPAAADDDDHKFSSSTLDARMARRIAREHAIARQGTPAAEDDDDDAHSTIGINDFEATDISSMIQDDSKCDGDLSLLMALLRPKALSQLLGHT